MSEEDGLSEEDDSTANPPRTAVFHAPPKRQRCYPASYASLEDPAVVEYAGMLTKSFEAEILNRERQSASTDGEGGGLEGANTGVGCVGVARQDTGAMETDVRFDGAEDEADGIKTIDNSTRRFEASVDEAMWNVIKGHEPGSCDGIIPSKSGKEECKEVADAGAARLEAARKYKGVMETLASLHDAERLVSVRAHQSGEEGEGDGIENIGDSTARRFEDGDDGATENKIKAHEQSSRGGIISSAGEKEEGPEAAIAGVRCVEVARWDNGVIETEPSFDGTACLVSDENEADRIENICNSARAAEDEDCKAVENGTKGRGQMGGEGIGPSDKEEEERSEVGDAGVGCVKVAREHGGPIKTDASFDGSTSLGPAQSRLSNEDDEADGTEPIENSAGHLQDVVAEAIENETKGDGDSLSKKNDEIEDGEQSASNAKSDEADESVAI